MLLKSEQLIQCRLCLRERNLQNSHIIPEFLYRPGYDEKGRMLAMEKGNRKSLYIQKGLREKLLCSECENLLSGKYEVYFSRLWYSRKVLPKRIKADFLDIEVDYVKFKLFHLSILWRASISSLQPFQQVNLTPNQNEQLRQMLLSGNPSSPTENQIFAALLLYPQANIVLDGFIMSPVANSFENKKVYIFVFGGCSWQYVIGKNPIETLMPFSLSAEGKMKLRVREVQHLTPITRFFVEEVSKMKFPVPKIKQGK